MAAFFRASIVLAAAAALSSTAHAQEYATDVVFDVGFFERVAVGDVEITPFGIREESRCHDPELCFRNDRLIVSAILHLSDGPRREIVEIPLRLGRPTPVPGGELWLLDAGTPPVRIGAIALKKYRFAIQFVPYR